jgi:hypothetical protein
MRGKRHAPAALYPRERPGTHCTGDWVGRTADLDRYGKSRPHRDSIPRTSSPLPEAIPTELPGQRIREQSNINYLIERCTNHMNALDTVISYVVTRALTLKLL